jgi:hypothetical protein
MKRNYQNYIDNYTNDLDSKIEELESKIRSSSFIDELLHAKDRETRKFILEWIKEGIREARDHLDTFMIWLKEALLGLYKIESHQINDKVELERMKNNVKEIIGFEV